MGSSFNKNRNNLVTAPAIHGLLGNRSSLNTSLVTSVDRPNKPVVDIKIKQGENNKE